MKKILNSLSKRGSLELRMPAYFERWCSYAYWSYQEAVALLIGLEPNEKFKTSLYTTFEFDEIYKCLTYDIAADKGHSPHAVDWDKSVIEPETFVKWAEKFLNKPVFLPDLVNFKDQYFKKCTADDERVAEYAANLEMIKAWLAAYSSKELKNEVEDYGFQWTTNDTDLEILRKGLIDYKFIQEITYPMFRETFCHGPPSAKIIWLDILVPLRYLLDGLKDKGFIKNVNFCAQAERVFQQNRKGRLVEIKRKTLYVATEWASNKKEKKKLIDIIINDLINGGVSTS